MRKRVTFVENLKNENLFKNRNGHSCMRSAEADRRCTGVFSKRGAVRYGQVSPLYSSLSKGHCSRSGCEYLPAQQVRESYRGTQINVHADSQHLKTTHPPTSVMSAAFLQRPTFIGGHRTYLYSIANIYSTEHMRRQMKQRYLDVLHACIQSGQNETRRRTCGDHPHREKRTFKTDPEKSAATASKQQRQRRSSDRAYSDVTFPKIVNR